MSPKEQPAETDDGALFGAFGWAAAAGIVGLGGLFLAAHAGSGVAYYDGLVFFALSLLVIFVIIQQSYDRAEGLSSGLPLFIRAAVALAVACLVYGPAPQDAAQGALVMAILVAGAVFALLSAIDRVLIQTR